MGRAYILMKFKEYDTVKWPNGKATYVTIISIHPPDTYTIEWGPNGFERYVEDVKEHELEYYTI